MFGNGFWNRLIRVSTAKRIALSLDWPIGLGSVAILYYIFGRGIMNYQVDEFITSATSLSQSLVAITITGIAIIVALTNRNMMTTLRQIDSYDSLMVVFELTVFAAIITTLLGIFLTAYQYGAAEVYIFVFSFVYMIINIFRLVSDIVTFGEKMTRMMMIEDLPDDIDEIVATTGEDSSGDETENTAVGKD